MWKEFLSPAKKCTVVITKDMAKGIHTLPLEKMIYFNYNNYIQA